MAEGYLSDSLKEQVNSAWSKFHKSFVRPVTIFKIGQKVAIASSADYNAFYRKNTSSSERIERSVEIEARIKYVKMEEEIFTEKDGSSLTSVSSKIILPAGSVKFKVDLKGYELMQGAKRVEFDGLRFDVKHNPRPIGFFTPTHYEFLLFPVNE